MVWNVQISILLFNLHYINNIVRLYSENKINIPWSTLVSLVKEQAQSRVGDFHVTASIHFAQIKTRKMADESAKIEQSMAADKNDREVVEQFCMLMEKARKLFDGLRYSFFILFIRDTRPM